MPNSKQYSASISKLTAADKKNPIKVLIALIDACLEHEKTDKSFINLITVIRTMLVESQNIDTTLSYMHTNIAIDLSQEKHLDAILTTFFAYFPEFSQRTLKDSTAESSVVTQAARNYHKAGVVTTPPETVKKKLPIVEKTESKLEFKAKQWKENLIATIREKSHAKQPINWKQIINDIDSIASLSLSPALQYELIKYLFTFLKDTFYLLGNEIISEIEAVINEAFLVLDFLSKKYPELQHAIADGLVEIINEHNPRISHNKIFILIVINSFSSLVKFDIQDTTLQKIAFELYLEFLANPSPQIFQPENWAPPHMPPAFSCFRKPYLSICCKLINSLNSKQIDIAINEIELNIGTIVLPLQLLLLELSSDQGQYNKETAGRFIPFLHENEINQLSISANKYDFFKNDIIAYLLKVLSADFLYKNEAAWTSELQFMNNLLNIFPNDKNIHDHVAGILTRWAKEWSNRWARNSTCKPSFLSLPHFNLNAGLVYSGTARELTYNLETKLAFWLNNIINPPDEPAQEAPTSFFGRLFNPATPDYFVMETNIQLYCWNVAQIYGLLHQLNPEQQNAYKQKRYEVSLRLMEKNRFGKTELMFFSRADFTILLENCSASLDVPNAPIPKAWPLLLKELAKYNLGLMQSTELPHLFAQCLLKWPESLKDLAAIFKYAFLDKFLCLVFKNVAEIASPQQLTTLRKQLIDLYQSALNEPNPHLNQYNENIYMLSFLNVAKFMDHDAEVISSPAVTSLDPIFGNTQYDSNDENSSSLRFEL